MKEVFAGRQGFLYDMLRYHLGWIDQEGRPADNQPPFSFLPALALAVCRAISGDMEPALPAAAGVELVRNFTLVHGEVQSARVESPERPSVWWVWGPAQAINAGDGLHALGRTTIMRLAQRGVPPEGVLRAVETMDRACLALCEGQYMDLDFQDQTLVTSAAYFHMVDLKSGALAGCAAELGAISAAALGGPATEHNESHFREFGKGLGTAWQITLDVADMWGREGGGMTPSNALNKKKGLPLVHALETASPSAKRQLATIYVKRVLEDEDLSRLVNILDESGSRRFAEAKARELAGEAVGHLEDCGLPSEAMEELAGMAEWVLEGGA
jgi:geranylgeranyl diphosphate synthase type I